MGKGLIYGAMAGLGKGIYETNKMDAEQQLWNERQQKQQDFQVQMEEKRFGQQKELQDRSVAGQKDLEKWRLDTAETLRQERMKRVQGRADERLAGMPNATPLQRSQVLAEEGALDAGDTSMGYKIQTDERNFKENRRMHDATIGHQANTDRRAQAEFDFKMGEAKQVAEYTKLYREAVTSGDADGARKYGMLIGIKGDDKSTMAQLATVYSGLAKQSADAGDLSNAKLWREAAASLVGIGVASKPGALRPPAGKPGEKKGSISDFDLSTAK